MLKDEDNIGLLTLSDDLNFPYITNQCSVPNRAQPVDDPYVMTSATAHNKNLLLDFINSLSKGTGKYGCFFKYKICSTHLSYYYLYLQIF